jgi:hypothetical protein
MASSTLKFKRECKAFHRPASWHRNFSRIASINMATAKAPVCQASGDTTFVPYHSLYVDNFGIKYVHCKHAEHLASILNKHYKCTPNWEGQHYFGMNLDWDYSGQKVHVSMLDYIPEVLACFQHQAPHTPQHQPYPYIKPIYCTKVQHADTINSSPPLGKADTKYIQEVISIFL